MKRIFSIFIMLFLLMVFTGCSDKYTTVYCDFDIGTFESQGHYQLKSTAEIEKFKKDHQTKTSFNDKLKYDEKYFNNKYLIVLVMPAEESDVKYEIQKISYNNSTLEVSIKKENKSNSGGTNDGANNGSNNNGSNNDSNNGNNNNGSNDNVQNDPTIGDNNPSMPDNNGDTNNNPSMPDNNSGNNNGGMDGSMIDENNGTENQNPSDNTNDSKVLIHKGFILEFKKNNTVTKINLNII